MINLFALGKAYAQTGGIGAGDPNSTDVNRLKIPWLTSGSFADIIARALDLILLIAGIIAVVILVYGGIQYMTAGGDSAKADKGRTTIVNAIIGIAIIALAFLIVRWVENAIKVGTPTA